MGPACASVPAAPGSAAKALRRRPSWPMAGGALAPTTPVSAFMDWAVHLLASPAKQWEIAQYGSEQWLRAWRALAMGDETVQALPQDKRFVHPAWQIGRAHG